MMICGVTDCADFFVVVGVEIVGVFDDVCHDEYCVNECVVCKAGR